MAMGLVNGYGGEEGEEEVPEEEASAGAGPGGGDLEEEGEVESRIGHDVFISQVTGAEERDEDEESESGESGVYIEGLSGEEEGLSAIETEALQCKALSR